MTPEEFLAHRYHYVGAYVNNHDGDTLHVDLDLGFNRIGYRATVRLIGCNAPELRDPGGQAARLHLDALLAGETLYVVTKKLPGEAAEQQSFARWLANVYVERDGQLVDVAQQM